MRAVHTDRSWLDESLSIRAFTIAGGLLLMSPTHVIAAEFAGVQFPTWLIAVFVLPGLLAALVGLAGLYPGLRPHHPHIARAASVSAAATGILLVGLLATNLVNALLTVLTGTTLGVVPGVVIGMLPVGLALAFGLFGIAACSSNPISWTTSLLLIGLTLPWLGVLVATALIGDAFPGWLTLVLFAPLPFGMFGLATSLRRTARKTMLVDSTSNTIVD